MNQLETNLVIWAICSILLFEILLIICICRCCFNRIKPKRFYVKREEYEFLHGTDGTPSQFQSTILRPPHADELAVVGTIREQNNGIQNFGYYRNNDDDDDDDDDEIVPPIPPLPASTSSPPQHINWIELRSPVLTTNNDIGYEYQHTPSSLPSRPTIDFRQYDDTESDDFRFHPHIRRTDTSTDTNPGNYSTLVPKSILKSSTGTTPPIDIYPESPRTSVKINTDESILMDYPISAIEKTIPNQMRYASVIQLNDIEWEVPREFQTIVYDLTGDKQFYHSNENLNNNNNNIHNYEKLTNRQRTQSAITDQRTNISRIFVPWDREKSTQQQAFEY